MNRRRVTLTALLVAEGLSLFGCATTPRTPSPPPPPRDGVVAAPGQGPTGSVVWPQNGHAYRRIDQEGLTFAAAQAAAASMGAAGWLGRLAIFEGSSYRDEMLFVRDRVYAPGVSGDRVYWVGAFRPLGNQQFHQGWTWVDGTPVPEAVTRGWNIDFHEGRVAEGASFFRPASEVLWDYDASATALVSGFIVEFEPQPK